MKAFECTGYWWLPEKENDGCAGTLKVSQSGDLHLWLIGVLGQPGALRNKNHPIVHGRVDKSPVGEVVTLSECMMRSSTIQLPGKNRENYRAAHAYFGDHLNPEDFAFKTLNLRLAGLSEWAYSFSGFVDDGVPVSEQPTSVLSYAHKKSLTATVQGARVTFGVNFRTRQTHRERSFKEGVVLNITCDTARAIVELDREYVYPLQNLMTFVSDRPQELEEFIIQLGDVTEDSTTTNIHVIGARVQPEEEENASQSIQHFQMLFTLADVDFSDFIGKWLQITNTYKDACNVFFGLQYGPPAYLDMTFPMVIQSLYLYYCRRQDGHAAIQEEEKRLKEILSALPTMDADWLVDRLGGQPFPPLQLVLQVLVEEHSHAMNPLMSCRQDRFINEVMNTVKHIVFREAQTAPAARHGADLYWMIQKLRLLFKSCMLIELGFSKEKIVELFGRNSLYQHICQLEVEEENQRQKTD